MWAAFVLSGTWPGLGGGQGLTPGKDNMKAIIKQHGESVTSGFSCLTNALVIGDNPGQKKILKAHEQGLSIVKLDQITSIITYDGKTAQDLLLAQYPEAALVGNSDFWFRFLRPPMETEF